MINGKIDDEAEMVSGESWRTKFYGLIKDGRKQRFSPAVLKICLSLVGTLICALQIYSGFTANPIKLKSGNIESPRITVQSLSDIHIPEFNPGKEAAQLELESRSRREKRDRGTPVPKLRSIRLSSVTGIPTGTEVSASLSSGGSNGTVVAKVSGPLIVEGEVVFPAGTTFFGRGNSNDERLFIKFKKAILPDKTELNIQAQAFDGKDRMIGLKGKRVSDYAFKLAASSGLIFLSGLAEGLKSNDGVNIFGNQSKPNVRDAALNGVATATSEQGKQILERMKNDQSRVEVSAETQIVVIFGSDVSE